MIKLSRKVKLKKYLQPFNYLQNKHKKVIRIKKTINKKKEKRITKNKINCKINLISFEFFSVILPPLEI